MRLEMRWLKHTTIGLLLIAAAAVALATGLSGHSDDYGQVGLPQGGTVELPKGTVSLYYRAPGEDAANSQITEPLSLQVMPAAGGEPLREASTSNGTTDLEFQRNEDIGSLGTTVNVDVPAAGAYLVSSSAQHDVTGSRITFGTTTSRAFAGKWKLLAVLVGAAILVALIPIPRRRRAWEDDPEPAWSSDPTSPYEKAGDRAPYAG
jgi:hypothetical protein